MKNLLTFCKTVFLCCMLMSVNGPSIAAEDTSMAEGNALRYMIALFSTDMNEVLSTIHPEAVNEMYSDFMLDLKQAEKENRQYSFLAGAGIYLSPEELKAMPKKQLFALVVKSNNGHVGQDHLKNINFKILGSTLINDETLIVSMAMGKAQPDNEFKLEMKRNDQEWLVIRSFLDNQQTSI